MSHAALPEERTPTDGGRGCKTETHAQNYSESAQRCFGSAQEIPASQEEGGGGVSGSAKEKAAPTTQKGAARHETRVPVRHEPPILSPGKSRDPLNQSCVRCGSCREYLKITADQQYDFFWHSCRCTATPVKLLLQIRSPQAWRKALAEYDRYREALRKCQNGQKGARA